MILVDSSVWIDFFTGSQADTVLTLEKLIADEEEVCLSDHILTEVLQGFRDDREFDAAWKCLQAFPIIQPRDRYSYLEAAQIYRYCRKQGIAIRNTADCLIARTAIENNLYLLHRDADFNLIASICPLRIYPVVT